MAVFKGGEPVEGREDIVTVEVQLDERTLIRLKRMAESQRLTIETVLKDMIERFVEAETASDPVLGMFAQEPELMDAVMAAVMEARETDPLRQPNA